MNNCIGKDSIVINQKLCTETFFIPSAFTPNADGKNDYFKPIITGNVQRYLFTIYNRWGQKIFETARLQKGWNGTINGKQQDMNVFVWTCTYQFVGAPPKFDKGTISLIR